MIKKIYHLADLHIRNYQFHELYQTQFNKIIHSIRDNAMDYDYEEIRIVIAGDIAHSKIVVSNEQLILTSWFFNKLAEIGKLVIIPGNHDFIENNPDRVDSITPIIELNKSDNINYYRDMGVYDDDNVKWVVYSLYTQNERPDFVVDNKSKYIGLFHGPIQGMCTDLGFEFDDGYSILNFFDLDIVLCGDIHKRQILYLDSGEKRIPVIQIGSAIQQNYGESIENHGYGIYDVEKDVYNTVNIENKQPFLHLRITDIIDIENETEVLVNS